MANIEKLKITEDKTRGKHVADLPTNPSESLIDAVTLQKRFDELPELVIEMFNMLLDYLVANGAGDKITAQTVGARPSTWMPSAADVGALPVYLSLDSIGLTDDDMVTDDFATSMKTILTALPNKTMLNITTTANTPNLQAMIHSKLNSDLGTSYGTNHFVHLVINKWATINGISEIRVFVDQATGRKRIYTCLYDTSSGTPNISKFAESFNDVGFLPLDGSVAMSGVLKLASQTIELYDLYGRIVAGAGTLQLEARTNKSATDKRTLFIRSSQSSADKSKAVQMIDNLSDGTSTYYSMYGEHNKPSGSYTGNGSATTREIAVGGIGNMLVIQGNGVTTYVTYNGGFSHTYNTGATKTFLREELNYNNGVLTIATADNYVNSNGIKYSYDNK